MQLEQFDFLSSIDKEEAVWKYGVFLETISNGITTCDVYQLFDFFVALHFELFKDKKPGIIAKPSRNELMNHRSIRCISRP